MNRLDADRYECWIDWQGAIRDVIPGVGFPSPLCRLSFLTGRGRRLSIGRSGVEFRLICVKKYQWVTGKVSRNPCWVDCSCIDLNVTIIIRHLAELA